MKGRLILIFLCALLIRMALILLWYQSGNGDRISADGREYHMLAKNLMEGKGFVQEEGIPTSRRPPLYPVFIGVLSKWGSFPVGVQIAQAFIGALSCVVLFGVGKEMFGSKVGGVASSIMVLDYVSIRQTVSIMTETLFMLPLLASFYFLVRSEKGRRIPWLIGAGFLAGISLLIRDVLIFYYPLLILWFFLEKESLKTRIYRAGIFGLSLLLTIGPWAIRNSLFHQRPVLITTTGGYTFYLANNPTTSGGTTGGDWQLGPDGYPPQDVPLPPPAALTLDWEQYLVKKSFDFIREHPRRFTQLTAKKIMNMWRPYQTDSPLASRWATALTYLPALIFGLWGMFQKLKHWKEFFPIFVLVAYTFSLHAILIAHMRYRYPVMPFFMIFAALAFVEVWREMRTRYYAGLISH